MKNSLQIVLKQIKELKTVKLPVPVDELQKMLDSGKQSEFLVQNNEILKIKRRKKMITIWSVLTTGIISAMLYLLQPGGQLQLAVNKNEVNAGKINVNTASSVQKETDENKRSESKFKSQNEEFSLKSFTEVPPATLQKKSSEFKWNEIIFDQIHNEFMGKQIFKIVDSNNKFIGARHEETKIEFIDLIKIYDGISAELAKYDFFGKKDIGYLDENMFYKELNKAQLKMQMSNLADSIYQKFVLYAMISHKLSNQSSGINFLTLSKSELEQIGIFTTDSSYYYQTEMIYEEVPAWLDEEFNKHSYPKDRSTPILAKFDNYVYWWVHEKSENNDVNIVDGYNEPVFSELKERNGKNKVDAVMARFTKNYSGWRAEDYNPFCPVLESSTLNSGLLNSPLMYFDKGKLRKYYDMMKEYWKFNESWRIEGISKRAKDSLMKIDSRMMKDVERQQMNLQANTLIPVKLPVPANNNHEIIVPPVYIYFLFAPTEEFIGKLPVRYRESLKKEINAIRKIETGEMNYLEACKGLTSEETIFDVCKIESENIKDVLLYPNPAKSSVKLEFSLINDRFIYITLSDMNGKFIKVFKSWEKASAGRILQEYQLENLEKGLYLLTILTEKGERIVHRLIVE